MRVFLSSLILTGTMLLPQIGKAQFAVTQIPQGITLQGKIIQPDGLPLEAEQVIFNIQVLSPAPSSCVLYEEIRTLNMLNSKGQIHFVVGKADLQTQTVSTGLGLPVHLTLKNTTPYNNVLKCAPGHNAYIPAAGDTRKIRVSFEVNHEVVTLSPDLSLKSVPYSFEAENAVALQGKQATDFIQTSSNITQEKLDSLLIPQNFEGLISILNPHGGSSSTGSIGVPISDPQQSIPEKDGLLRYDPVTQTYQVSIGGVWQNLITNSSVIENNLAVGSVSTLNLSDGSVTTPKLANSAVSTAKIANEAVTSDKIRNLSITNNKIADGAITFDKIANNAVSTIKILDSAVTSEKILDGSIQTVDLSNGLITTPKLADLNVTTAKIADEAVLNSKLAADSVSTVKIVDLNVTTGKLAADAVTNAKLANNAVSTQKILDLNVTTAKIAEGNVTDSKIASVSGSKVSGNIPGLASGFTGALVGDVTGAQTATRVQALQGRGVANVAPGGNQVLKWNGSQWAPGTDDNTITTVNPGYGMTGGGTGNISLGLAASGVAAGWYGSNTAVPRFYVDSAGRITSVSLEAITTGAGCGSVPHGRVTITNGTCSAKIFQQCLNGSTISLGTIGSTSCDGDGDGSF